MGEKQLMIKIAPGPVCPACSCDTFDDWHHERSIKQVGLAIAGRLKCHGCGRFFGIHRYSDGEVHSTMWRKAA